jgi:hypothetical protein
MNTGEPAHGQSPPARARQSNWLGFSAGSSMSTKVSGGNSIIRARIRDRRAEALGESI